MPERARLAGDPLGIALRPDRGHHQRAHALDGEGAGANLLAGLALHRARLAGQHRLVDPEAARGHELSVRDDLVARLKLDEIPHHDLVHVQATTRTVPDDGRSRLHERRERVERPLRTYLLEDPDRRVGDDHTEEQGVAHVAERDHEHAEHDQDQVEDREDVRPDDARVGTARLLRGRPRPSPEASAGFEFGQALGGGRDGNRRRGHRAKATTRRASWPARRGFRRGKVRQPRGVQSWINPRRRLRPHRPAHARVSSRLDARRHPRRGSPRRAITPAT